MRWLVGLLVLANLAFAVLAYVVGRRQSPDAQLVNLEMNADKVKLLERPAVPEKKAPAPAAEAATARVEQIAPPRACLEWGNFTAAELERARTKLAEAAPGVKFTTRELADTPAWWVYIPPAKSRDDVDQTVERLKGLGVTQVHVVTDSERWRNAISLGIFKTEAAAAAFLAELKERKVKGAQTGQRNNLVRLAVIVIAEPSDKTVAAVTGLKDDIAGSEIRAGACPGGRS